jgi:hypothetical protein
MEEMLKQPECFLIREEPISRLSKLVFAASEACRRGSSDPQRSRAALPRALGAQCTRCGFALSGVELLALAQISGANDKSTMLQRLRAGQCAREGCKASHYRLRFYDIQEINWSELLISYRPRDNSQSEVEEARPVPMAKQAIQWRYTVLKLGQVCGVIGFCLLVWVMWRLRTGGSIPILRQPEHFRVAPANVDHPPAVSWAHVAKNASR